MSSRFNIVAPPVSGGLVTVFDDVTAEAVWSNIEPEAAELLVQGAEYGITSGEKEIRGLLAAVNQFFDAVDDDIIYKPDTDVNAIDAMISTALERAERAAGQDIAPDQTDTRDNEAPSAARLMPPDWLHKSA